MFRSGTSNHSAGSTVYPPLDKARQENLATLFHGGLLNQTIQPPHTPPAGHRLVSWIQPTWDFSGASHSTGTPKSHKRPEPSSQTFVKNAASLPESPFARKLQKVARYDITRPGHEHIPPPVPPKPVPLRTIYEIPTFTSTATLIDSTLGATTTKACISCSEDLPPSDFSGSKLTTFCNHSNNACTTCVKRWIETRVTDGSWNQISCLECNQSMQYADIQRHADPQVFERYDLLTARSWLNNETNFIWCRNPNCGSGQVHEGGSDAPVFRCNACGERFCVIHEVPWHQGETCEAFDRRMSGQVPDHGGDLEIGATAQMSNDSWTDEMQSRHMPGSWPDRLDWSLHEEHGAAYLQEHLDLNHSMQSEYTTPSSSSSSHETNPFKKKSSRLAAKLFSANQGYLRSPNNNFSQYSQQYEAVPSQPSAFDAFYAGFPYQQANYYDQYPQYRQQYGDYEYPYGIHNEFQYAQNWQGQYLYSPDYLAAGLSSRHARYRQITSPQAQSYYLAQHARNLEGEIEREDRNGQLEQRFQQLRTQQMKVQQHDKVQFARSLQEELKQEELERAQKDWQRQQQRLQQQQLDQQRQEREAYQCRKAEESQGEQTVKRTSKQCPRCKWYIQKKDGCDHMTCYKCKYEFCFACLADYQTIRNNGNSAHRAYCSSYR